MKMSMFEKGECFRAFLLLIASDRVVAAEERRQLLDIGRKMDFEGRFCESSIDDLLENKHIPREPPLFSRPEFAEGCLRDCLMLAAADREIHPSELEWVTRIAVRNGLTPQWVDHALGEVRRSSERSGSGSRGLAIEQYV